MYNLFTMDNKEVLSPKDRVLTIIMAVCLMIFFGWLDIASGFEEIGPATITILSVSGGIFLIAFIIYIIPVMKAKKVAKENFYKSINNREKNIFDEFDKDPFEEYNKDPFKEYDDRAINNGNDGESK